MSDVGSTATHPKRSLFANSLPLATAILLGLVYFRVEHLSESWTATSHLVFRIFIIITGFIGTALFLTALKQYARIPAWMRVSQHFMSIPLEGWFYLGIMFVLFTGAMLTKQNTLLLVFAFMAGPFIINGWMTFGMLQSARVERHAPKRAMQDELFAVELTLHNRRPLFALWMMSISDEIRHALEKLEGNVLFSRVSPRTSQTGLYDVRLANRGRYQLGPIQISSRFPLGLVERSRLLQSTTEVLIYPRLGRIAPQWRMRLMGATELVSRNVPHRGVFNDDFHRLREFRSGDNPRAIHWRSTARRGELILREFHQNREHTLAVILDLYRPLSPDSSYLESIELALSFVASLVVERGRECRDGFLTLAATGQRIFRWEGQGHTASLESLFDGLAVFEPGLAAETAETLSETLKTCAPSTQILVVTTREGVLPYQELLTSRVDLLNLREAKGETVLIFDDGTPRRRIPA